MTPFARRKRPLIEAALNRCLRLRPNAPNARLIRAMRYSVFPGGKRFRAMLVLAAARACGGDIEAALQPAAAVELVHSFSLVHDDLPALDNDDYRRGRPSCHKRFGEALALLAGDALLARAFEVIAETKNVVMFKALAHAIGSDGMVAGQVAELEGWRDLKYIHSRKTGALIAASVLLGAQAAGAGKKEALALRRFGCDLGAAFQLIDDLLDDDGYAKVRDRKSIRDEAVRLVFRAKSRLRPFGKKAGPLLEIADFVLKRREKRRV